jgi:hypothetical protein
MTDPTDRIRQILERHRAHGQSDDARQVAEAIVAQLGLQREHAENKMRYVSAWFDGELTKLEGAE